MFHRLDPQTGVLPGRFTYLNFGKSTQQGFELGVNCTGQRVSSTCSPTTRGRGSRIRRTSPLSELNLPATNRFNAGVGLNYNRFLANLSVSYSDSAYWQDVLDAFVFGHDRSLHARERQLRRQVDGRPASRRDQGDQPRQRRCAAACLRRHHQAQIIADVEVISPSSVCAGRFVPRNRRSPTCVPMIRLLALDIDGTLLDSHGRPS